MGEAKEVTTLRSLLGELESLDNELTIYAREPWTLDSAAIAALEPADGGLPVEAENRGLSYFLEVSIGREFLEAWGANIQPGVTPEERLERLIRYAIDDA
jgi:hypothetical protein